MTARRDFRKLDPSAQAEARHIAVLMVKAGKTRIEAAGVVGVNRRFVGEWIKAEKARGITTVHIALDKAADMDARGLKALKGEVTAVDRLSD